MQGTPQRHKQKRRTSLEYNRAAADYQTKIIETLYKGGQHFGMYSPAPILGGGVIIGGVPVQAPPNLNFMLKGNSVKKRKI